LNVVSEPGLGSSFTLQLALETVPGHWLTALLSLPAVPPFMFVPPSANWRST
jgi:two-component system capsular synthesis sensor histidine kinase RcsC